MIIQRPQLKIYTYEVVNGIATSGEQTITKNPNNKDISTTFTYKSKSLSNLYKKQFSKRTFLPSSSLNKTKLSLSTEMNISHIKPIKRITIHKHSKPKTPSLNKSFVFSNNDNLNITSNNDFNNSSSSKNISFIKSISSKPTFYNCNKTPTNLKRTPKLTRQNTASTHLHIRSHSGVTKIKIEKSIGEIIQLKNQITSAKKEQLQLTSQKNAIINYYDKKIKNIHQIKQYHLNQKKSCQIKQEQNAQHCLSLKSKQISLNNQLLLKQQEITHLQNEYNKQLINIEDEYKQKENIINSYLNSSLSLLSTSTTDNSIQYENNNNTSYTLLSKQDMYNISFILRIILSIIQAPLEMIHYKISELSSRKQTIKSITDYFYSLINNKFNLVNICSKQLLYDFMYNLSFINKSCESSIEKLQHKLFTEFQELLTYDKNTVNSYHIKLRKVFTLYKNELIEYINTHDTMNVNIISLDLFNKFIESHDYLRKFFEENNEIYQYIIYIMKKPIANNNLFTLTFYDLNMSNLLMIIENNNNLFQLRTKDYHINIKNFLQKQSSLYTFNDFIIPLKHHIITQRNIHYIKINIFEFWLRINRIILQYQTIDNNNNEYLNLAELNNKLCKL